MEDDFAVVIVHLDQTPKSSLLLSRYRERFLDVKYMSILAKAIRNSQSERNIYMSMDKKWKFDLFMMRKFLECKPSNLEKPNDFQYEKKQIIENCDYLKQVGWLRSVDKETMLECSKKMEIHDVLSCCRQDFLRDREFLIAILKNAKLSSNRYQCFYSLFKDSNWCMDREILELLASKYGYVPHVNNLEKDFELGVMAAKSGQRIHSNFSYLPDNWKETRESILMAFEIDPECLELISKSFRKDKELMMQIIQSEKGIPQKIAKHLDESLLKVREFAIYALTHDSSIEYLVKILKLDKEMLKIIAKRDAYHFPTNHSYRNDRELMIEMLKCGVSYEKFDESLQDMQIVKESLIYMRFPVSFSFIKLELRKDRELTKMALEINPHIFRYIYFEFKSDLEIALLAIRKLPNNLQFMTTAFKKNPEIILPVLELDPLTLQYVDPSIENYHELVMNCAKRDPATFRFVKEQDPFLPQILSIVPQCFHCIHADVHGRERFKYLEFTLQYDVSNIMTIILGKINSNSFSKEEI
ncbi:predicted protein [Naegleria gruberi]|uniref:Predicted protein n=1 Tax=Naegleria gruberi TaxID=5762 RepID=D2VJW5_NAEGR|nr:uncharacterized protein NAEGRDRAFT_50155 [Naegleria gruberi]EFC42761.1 predicted protein [Naegleria gruberi]|eukprot:XP_002675505.1 predicted protein [Naegleria gruberi strain NEG-M]